MSIESLQCERHGVSGRLCQACNVEHMLNHSPVIRQLFGGPRYRYWTIDRPRFHRTFEYTTERTSDGRFWAIERRWSRGVGRIIRRVAFRRRRAASERAYAWYEKAGGGIVR